MNIKDLRILNRKFGKRIFHVEAPHLFGEKLINYAKKRKIKCYCICPSNYEYISSSFGLKDKRNLFETTKKTYLILKRLGSELQLHVHLSMFPKNLTYEKKENLIKNAYDFFIEELDVIPKEIVFGWWAYDKEAKEIADKLRLKIVNKHFHFYDWWL